MYAAEVQKLKQDSGFQSADVIQLHPNHEMREELRGKFLDEHVHSDDEIRFFVDGCGLFYMHFEEEVISVMCKRGDLIGVPAQTKHWFDMGPNHPLPVSDSLLHQMAGLLILPVATSLNGSHDLRTIHREVADMDFHGYRRYHDQYLLCS